MKDCFAASTYILETGYRKIHFYNSKIHRADGPAIEDNYGYKVYFLDGNEYSFEEWDRLRKLLIFK